MHDTTIPEDVVILDGREVGTFHNLCRQHWRGFVEKAVEAKQKGTGILARPESDVGLLNLCLSLDRVDPDGGWKRKAYATLIRTIDDALRAGGAWTWSQYECILPRSEDPLRDLVAMGRNPVPADAKGAKDRPALRALLNMATKVTGAYAAAKIKRSEGIDAEIISRLDHTPIQEAFAEDGPDVVHAAELRIAAADRQTEALGGSTNNWQGPDLPPLPKNFPPPLWRNENVPRLPLKSRAARWEVGWEIRCSIGNVFDSSRQASMITFALGASPEVSNFDDKGVHRDFTDSRWIYAPRPSWYDAMTEVAALELFLDGSPDRYLANVLTNQRIIMQYSHWSEDFHSFDVFSVGDERAREYWMKGFRTHPSKWRAAWLDQTYEILADEHLEDAKTFPKTDARFYHEAFRAFEAIRDRNTTAFDEILPKFLAAYRKLRHRRFTKELALWPIAFQREALRRGMDIKVPEDWPNHAPTVRAPEPPEPDTSWSIWPGLKLVVNNPDEPLAWPTLLLNRKIRRVVKSEADM